jgi:SAM-dependent methyltransferase
MRYGAIQRRLPGFLRAQILHFETQIEAAVDAFAAQLPVGARVLDAGAGEGRYREHFHHHRYTGLDLAVGDATWNYQGLDVLGDLHRLPFASATFEACLNIVTLEHVREPACVLAELARVLTPGGRLLLVVPHEWEVHQVPHDYYRYTRYGVAYLLERAGLRPTQISPAGGFFRLLSRRCWNAMQFFPLPLLPLVALPVAPVALLLPLLDGLDREQNFTLGYVCTAVKDR